jgi:hypothetical protein
MPTPRSTPTLLSQPDAILNKVTEYLGPRSVARLESVHPTLNKATSTNNRYWKDAYIRETENKNNIHGTHSEFAPSLPALKATHPNSEPQGYWKGRYRDEIHPAKKRVHDGVRLRREQHVESGMIVPSLIGGLAVAPAIMTYTGGAVVSISSVMAGIAAGKVQFITLGLSSPITLPIMGLSALTFIGGSVTAMVGLGAGIAVGIPTVLALQGVSSVLEWNFDRTRVQEDGDYVEES